MSVTSAGSLIELLTYQPGEGQNFLELSRKESATKQVFKVQSF